MEDGCWRIERLRGRNVKENGFGVEKVLLEGGRVVVKG